MGHMTTRVTEKIIDALSQLLEGYAELQDAIESEYSEDDVEDESAEDREEGAITPDSALVAEIRSAIEAAMEAEDYTPEEVANLIASLTEALEEIDPNVFDAEEEDKSEDEEEEYEEDDDDIDLDEDDDDYEEYDDDDDDDEDEDEEEDDDEED